ncbi:MAG: DUF4911 domain-containing protein [Methylocystaceae bacterium]
MQDIMITVQIDSANIDMLNRILEGAGHIGVMSTLNQQQGIVLIRATDGTAPEVTKIISHLPFIASILP